MPEVTLPVVLAAILALSLNAYVLFGGADFGGGVWDLLATGPRRARQREVISHAIGPIWEANHVWLILAIVLTFTCFPPVFARLGTVLHIPLTLMLVGIVLRGSAFTFRSYDDERDSVQRRWGRVFAGASLVTPVLLGVCIGAVAAGRVGPLRRGATFVQSFVDPWLTPFSLAVGLMTLALFAHLAAVFLTLETDEPALVEDFRARALWSGLAVFASAFGALLIAPEQAPLVGVGLLASTWSLPFHLATGVAALAALAALWGRRYHLARVAVGAQVSLIIWGWAIAQYPFLVPPDFTIDGVAAPAVTLRLVLITLGLGIVVLVPSLLYMFRVFKAGPSHSARRLPKGGLEL
ncbi:MAG TPA: cytochrome d ubiquinol oxidase subunit II [Gemmatimonadales bacterium]|nr:cytochrome d ubiquinol oxidase subunit II [Gemmatimonadales bacterium]